MELAHPVLAILVVTCSLLIVRLFHLAQYPYPAMSAEAVAFGHAEAPFHLRLLAPMMARGLFELTGLGRFVHWYFVVQFAFVTSAFAAIYVWLRLYFEGPQSQLGVALAPIILLWSMDMPAADAFPQVFFFTLAFIFLHQRRGGAFVLTFLVAVTNRETIAALLLPFLIHRWPSDGPLGQRHLRVAACVVVMAGWVVAWKLWIGPAFSPTITENKLALFQFNANLAMLTDWDHTLNPFAKNPFTILGYTWLLVLFAWKRLPAFVRMLCLCWLPYLGLMLVVAKITETRVHMEWTAVALAVAVTALQGKSLSKGTEPPTGPPEHSHQL